MHAEGSMGAWADHIDWVSRLTLERSARGNERRRKTRLAWAGSRRVRFTDHAAQIGGWTIAKRPMTVNGSARMPLNAHNISRQGGTRNRSYQQVTSPWRSSVFKVCAARMIGTTRSELAEAQTASALARAMWRVDVCPCQPNPEIRSQRPLPLADAIEDEVAGDPAIMRVLPEPPLGVRSRAAGIGSRVMALGSMKSHVAAAICPRGRPPP